jgi:murein L,D-transpeptidase YcbB/YkuD
MDIDSNKYPAYQLTYFRDGKPELRSNVVGKSDESNSDFQCSNEIYCI